MRRALKKRADYTDLLLCYIAHVKILINVTSYKMLYRKEPQYVHRTCHAISQKAWSKA